jgi:septal ring factor EnvC (AmiA/AmiB activator)
MINLSNLRNSIEEWVSPRYTRLRLKVDPVSKQITAETEEDTPPPRKFPIKGFLYTVLAVVCVSTVAILVIYQGRQVRSEMDRTQQQLALVDNQSRNVLEQTRKRAESLERQLQLTKDELLSLQEQSQEQLKQSRQEVDRLQGRVNVLQNQNEDLRSKVSQLGTDTNNVSEPTAKTPPKKPLEVMFRSPD